MAAAVQLVAAVGLAQQESTHQRKSVCDSTPSVHWASRLGSCLVPSSVYDTSGYVLVSLFVYLLRFFVEAISRRCAIQCVAVGRCVYQSQDHVQDWYAEATTLQRTQSMSCCGGVSTQETFDKVAASLPHTAELPEELPNVAFPAPAKCKTVGGVISDLDPAFIHQQLHVDGGSLLPLISIPSPQSCLLPHPAPP